MPLAHAGAEEPVEVLGAHAARPAIERAGDSGLVQRGEVGLADPGSAVTVLAQDLEHRRGAARDHRVMPGTQSRSPGSHPCRRNASCARSGWHATPRTRPRRGNWCTSGPAWPAGQGGRTRRPAERTMVPVADVVAHDNQHIGCTLRRRSGSGKSAFESEKARLISPRKGGSGAAGSIDRDSQVGRPWPKHSNFSDHLHHPLRMKQVTADQRYEVVAGALRHHEAESTTTSSASGRTALGGVRVRDRLAGQLRPTSKKWSWPGPMRLPRAGRRWSRPWVKATEARIRDGEGTAGARRSDLLVALLAARGARPPLSLSSTAAAPPAVRGRAGP